MPNRSFGTGSVRPPRRTPQIAQNELLISFTSCFGVVDHSAVYVSTPITTGPHFADWFPIQRDRGTPDYQRRLREDIIGPNLLRAQPLVAACRDRWPSRPVIDPTGLGEVPGWAQDDYHLFWCQLIQQCASTVVLAEGWQFSSGCALEFAAACVAGCQILDTEFATFSVVQGVALLTGAADRLAQVGASDTLLRLAITRCTADPDGTAQGARP